MCSHTCRTENNYIDHDESSQSMLLSGIRTKYPLTGLFRLPVRHAVTVYIYRPRLLHVQTVTGYSKDVQIVLLVEP